MKKEIQKLLFSFALRFAYWVLPDGNLKVSLSEWIITNKDNLTE